MNDEVLLRLMLCGARPLWSTLSHDANHDQAERPYQSVGHVILMPAAHRFKRHGLTRDRQRCGGLHHAYELAEKVV